MFPFQVKKTSSNSKSCTKQEDQKELGKIIFLILISVGLTAFAIYNAFDSKRESDLDRKILRRIYANQKLQMFGKDDKQIRSFAEKIFELSGKFST